MDSFWTGFGYSFGALMGLTCWITLLQLLWPKKKKPTLPAPPPPSTTAGA